MFLADADGLSLRRAAALDADSDDYPSRVLIGDGPLGRAALERRAQLVQSSRGVAETTICAPMVVSGRLVGLISLETRPSRFTGRNELLMLQAFAHQVAEILLARGDREGRLGEALERFRVLWLAALA